MKLIRASLTLCLVLTAGGAIQVQQSTPGKAAGGLPPAAPAGWKLVWADEFDVDGRPDARNWDYEAGFVRNRELQWYQPDNAWCERGMLIIEGRRERRRNLNYRPGSEDWRIGREHAEYTSASLLTRGRHAWQYGRFEMRARLDTRPGLWPAFWTLGASGEWPRGGEIDIMEYYRGLLLANVAWGTAKRFEAEWDSVRKRVTEFKDSDWADKFHVWRMEWDEQAIRLYVDDQLLNTTDLKQTYNRDVEGRNPFHQPHYIILNLAIGGEQGGDPSKTNFPARFEVDYVRIYQKEAPNSFLNSWLVSWRKIMRAVVT